MNENKPHQHSGISPHSVSTLGWGLFSRFFFANAGVLFLLGGIICFFAYNWEDLPAFAKFGMIAAGMLLSAIFPLLRGLDSTPGRLGLLACGILGGALMAVYGQVYQTGANAWELFRSWALFLIPLAILGRQAGLWFVLWLVSSLWGVFYLEQRASALHDNMTMENIVLYQCLAQTAFFVLWEAASRFLPKARFPFLESRWLPRAVGITLLAFLTYVASFVITQGENAPFGHPVIYTCLYLAFIGGGAFYYRVKQTDLLMVAAGLFSLIVLALTFIGKHIDHTHSSLRFFIMVVILVTGAAVSGKVLIARYKKWRENRLLHRENAAEPIEVPEAAADAETQKTAALLSVLSIPLLRLALEGRLPHPPSAEKDDEEPDEQKKTGKPHAPWQARLLMGICAWIAVPCLIALVYTLFPSNFGTREYAVLFLLLLCCGIALSWRKGIFLEQASLCLCLAGASAAGVLISMEIGNKTLCLLPSIILFAASAFPARNNAYRFLAATLAVTLCFFQADLFFYPHERPVSSHFGIIEKAAPVPVYGVMVFSLLYSACAVALAHFWRQFTLSRKLHLQHHPVIAALFTTPVLLGLFSVLFHSSKIMHFLAKDLGISGISIRPVGIGAAIGLGYLIFRLTQDMDMGMPSRIIMTMLCIPVAVVSWHMPWFGVGLFILALSRQAGSMVLLGTATLFLGACTILEYYALSTTLLMKSFSLGGIGIVLLLAATGMHQYMTWCLKKGWLHIPPALLPLSRHAGQARQGAITSGAATKRKSRLTRGIAVGCIVVFLLFFSHAVWQKEKLLENGERIILALRPVDPRALMQGDYMVLAMEIENEIYQALLAEKIRENDPDTYLKSTIVAAPDENGIFRFVRFDDGASLSQGEVRLVYRGKNHAVRVGSGAFFFQEGHGKQFENARFAELRVSGEGETLITHLLDRNKKRIDPRQQPAKDPA